MKNEPNVTKIISRSTSQELTVTTNFNVVYNRHACTTLPTYFVTSCHVKASSEQTDICTPL